MQIRDLPKPVVAAKSDWLMGTTWLGFTPASDQPNARQKCQSTIQRQCSGGYVIEYITESFEQPNKGYETDPIYLAERDEHEKIKGCFVSVHKLRFTSRPLQEIIGNNEFKHLQDMWAKGGKRHRWSVAFPIIETYRIEGRPKAKDVLGDDAYLRLFGHMSATLRPLEQHHQIAIANLKITPVPATNSWIGIEDEFSSAERSVVSSLTERLVSRDLQHSQAQEGMTEERWAKVRRRAAWIADKFIRHRLKTNAMHCDACSFSPTTIIDGTGIRPRSLLDVHHKHPLAEGVRYTTIEDFTLLCPTCHRAEHALMNIGRSLLSEQN